MLEVARRWLLRWQIANLERFIESPWCRSDMELAMLARRELRKRIETMKGIRT
jgi:hypothetical protein